MAAREAIGNSNPRAGQGSCATSGTLHSGTVVAVTQERPNEYWSFLSLAGNAQEHTKGRSQQAGCGADQDAPSGGAPAFFKAKRRLRMLHNSASGPESGFRAGFRPGRISAGFKSGKPQSRPSGRPSSGRSANFEFFPIRIRLKSNPEARFPGRKHYCVI